MFYYVIIVDSYTRGGGSVRDGFFFFERRCVLKFESSRDLAFARMEIFEAQKNFVLW